MHILRLTVLASLAMTLVSSCSGPKEQTSESVHNVFAVNPIALGANDELTLPAVVEEARTISVGFKTAGQIERIFVKEGQKVSAGQTIAMLDTVDYALGISAMREQFRQMQSENRRRAHLHASGNMSDNDYENAISGMRQLELRLRLEENKLGYCRLTAPTSGVVTKVNFEPSEMVDAGTPVIELIDNSSLEVIVDLPVRFYALRNSFAGFTGSSPAAGSSAIELRELSLTPRADNTQLYRLRLAPAGRVPAGITPGMNMTVTITCADAEGSGVKVPLSSVFERDGRTFVWVINPADSVISSREVITSSTGHGGTVEISSGIEASDLIVRAGVHHLTEGEHVNIISESDTNAGNVI